MIENSPKKIKMVDIIRPQKKSEPPKKIEPQKKADLKESFRPKIVEMSKVQISTFSKKEISTRTSKENKVRKKVPFRFILIIIVVGFLIYLAFWILPKASIDIITKKTPLELAAQIAVDKNISEVNISSSQIPAEVFNQNKNSVFSFPATGEKNVEKKASGGITIFNTFSSDNQPLVANTRLLAPDGKVFRLEKSIVVPGAKIVTGKVVSSSIMTTVVADKPGQEYNIGPVARFTIPGFQGSEKYQSFYAKSDVSMSGGFIGKVKVPTEDDINRAKTSAEQSLKDYFSSFFSAQIPNDFKTIDKADQFTVLKEDVSKEADDQGNFSVTIEAKKSIIGFKEGDVVAVFSNLAKEKLADGFTLNSYEISYNNIIADFNKKTLNFSADFKGIFQPPLDINDFKQKILGKSELDLKTFIFSQSDVDKATVSLWPFWVKRVPNYVNKINVLVK